MCRTPDILELIEEAPLAFTLAAIIALRARFRPGVSLKGLNPGESFIGDFKTCGMSEQQYRTSKGQLERWRFATFKPTTKGTVARLIDTRLFDVLNVAANGQSNGQPTDSPRLTKNGKNGKTVGKQKPSLLEVKAFASESKLSASEAEPFFDYYEGRDWRAGCNPVSNWQSCFKSWVRRSQKKPANVPRAINEPAPVRSRPDHETF